MRILPIKYSTPYKVGLIIMLPKATGDEPYGSMYQTESITLISLPFFRLTLWYRCLTRMEKLNRRIRRERIREAKNFRLVN